MAAAAAQAPSGAAVRHAGSLVVRVAKAARYVGSLAKSGEILLDALLVFVEAGRDACRKIADKYYDPSAKPNDSE